MKTITAFWADKIIAISKAVKNDSLTRYRVPERKMKIIYNGLNTDNFLIDGRRVVGKKIIIGSIGRLSPQKNYSLLIKALANLKNNNWECQIVGEGGVRLKLEKEITELGLTGKVKLLGLKKDIKGFLFDLDLFVLPSLWEGLGIVLLEAGLAGLPVLAF